VKVDRSVTGLVAQQQCVGPLHTPLADVAVIALSHFDKVQNYFYLNKVLQLQNILKCFSELHISALT